MGQSSLRWLIQNIHFITTTRDCKKTDNTPVLYPIYNP